MYDFFKVSVEMTELESKKPAKIKTLFIRMEYWLNGTMKHETTKLGFFPIESSNGHEKALSY